LDRPAVVILSMPGSSGGFPEVSFSLRSKLIRSDHPQVRLQKMPPIAILTDFGVADGYVAQMKGVILGINPAAQIVDISHSVAAGDIRSAGFLLDQVTGAFPPESVFLCVVDPGVGSSRKLIGVEAAGRRFLAPDNGLLTAVLRRSHPERVHQLTESRFWRSSVASTFHGRDILAPTAAHWNLDVDLSEFGSTITDAELVWLNYPEPYRDGRAWLGEVMAVDHFGNLVTNLEAGVIADEPWSEIEVTLGVASIRGISRYYSEHPAGGLIVLIGSSGRLEIAVNGGSAREQLGVGPGASVILDLPHSESP
jgi:S-adenosylmethionine hydrolase